VHRQEKCSMIFKLLCNFSKTVLLTWLKKSCIHIDMLNTHCLLLQQILLQIFPACFVPLYVLVFQTYLSLIPFHPLLFQTRYDEPEIIMVFIQEKKQSLITQVNYMRCSLFMLRNNPAMYRCVISISSCKLLAYQKTFSDNV
jgi:hypothetical protein